MTPKAKEKFFTHLPVLRAAGKCWRWQASLQASGYGNSWNGRTVETAHRMSYQIFTGPIPKGLDVRHTCDTRNCVNPAHLVLGTRSQNMRDFFTRNDYRSTWAAANEPRRGEDGRYH